MNVIRHVYEDVNAGLLDSAFIYRKELNDQIQNLLNYGNDTEWLTDDSLMEDLREAIIIGNATYNNSSSNLLPIEDGVWDTMVEKYRRYTPDDSYPVGFKPTKDIQQTMMDTSPAKKELFTVISDEEYEKINKMMYKEEILGPNDYIGQPRKNLFTVLDGYIPKRLTDTAHSHPDLVGTFDKCKFVLNAQAREKGVENDTSVRIMERDFFKPLLDAGVIDYSTEFTMIATLKYDGISVEADVTDRIVSARTRGDAVNGIATDITPILEDYRFPSLLPGTIPLNSPIGMKFEAIINNFNLYKLSEMKGNKYANCRTAMTGIVGSSDGYKYRDLITLVPISTDYKDENGEPLDRLVEIEFLNKYYAGDQLLRYAVMTGNYTSMLFQIKKYVEEAEFARSYIPFMYDGVVFEFYDEDLRRILGRDSAMDRYKCAIKFNPLTKQTIFRGYEFTIGQDGTITPMILYDPVEFFGTIHPNSSGHSYKNFKELDLHIGDIIDVTYRNDVITYVTKPDNAHNRANADNTEPCEFPTHCPICGWDLEISPSGKSAKCPNWYCEERITQRLAATFSKLGVVNFSEESIRSLLRYIHLYQFLEADVESFAKLGENNKVELRKQLDDIMKKPMYDYVVFGALGFNNIGDKTWQLIFNKIDWRTFINMMNDNVVNEDTFIDIKGIGKTTLRTIINEWKYFYDDIMYIAKHFNIISSFGKSPKKQIRFTGCRDAELETKMQLQGYDCDGKAGVTKQTSVLLVPYDGYNQGNKVKKAIQYGIPMVALLDFVANPNQYL